MAVLLVAVLLLTKQQHIYSVRFVGFDESVLCRGTTNDRKPISYVLVDRFALLLMRHSDNTDDALSIECDETKNPDNDFYGFSATLL